jgi:hypothetical protein
MSPSKNESGDAASGKARFDVPKNAPRNSSGFPLAPPTLSEADRIGVMGDLHGELDHAAIALKMFADKGLSTIVQLGDFGVIWPGSNWQTHLNKLGRMLAKNGQALYFIDGNHELFPRLLEFPISADGLRWVSHNVAHLPRGYRTQISGGTRALAVLGGANSHDRRWRVAGESWWPEEQITESDLAALGTKTADVLLGHESPAGGRPYVKAGAARAEMQYAEESQAMFIRGMLQVRPKLTMGGHYHRHADVMMTMPGDPSFETRAVILDRDGATGISQAILDPRTLELEFFYRDGRPAVRRTDSSL